MAITFSEDIQAKTQPTGASGEWIEMGGDTWYCINELEKMPVFFISLVSNCDLWMFLGSNGALSAGRRNSEHAIFPYLTEDKIIDSAGITGPRTLIRIDNNELWIPFADPILNPGTVTRSLSKNVAGNKIIFEEKHISTGLTFRYQWNSSDKYGFIRISELINSSAIDHHLEVLDGLKNILPAHSNTSIQQNSSNLLDAYKQNQFEPDTGIGIFSLASQLVDIAEPREALRTTCAWSLLPENFTVSIHPQNDRRFIEGKDMLSPEEDRGVRGAYYIHTTTDLKEGNFLGWIMGIDTWLGAVELENLKNSLADKDNFSISLEEDIARSHQHLLDIVHRTDGQQVTGDKSASIHHFANTLFNDMRGGIYNNGLKISSTDFKDFAESWNRKLTAFESSFFNSLPEELTTQELRDRAWHTGNTGLIRLSLEYLPITFSRRHGDPSRPWNIFDIHLKDDDGNPILNYQGNWRDIFQNWESLSLSYPGFIENIISKFLNATTPDGYNPYRIMRTGIDWECPDPDDPWSGIGYWGDHQIIYLLKLLELSKNYFPEKIESLLLQEIFVFSNIPYQLKSHEEILTNPRDTITFRDDLHKKILKKTEEIGADGKLYYCKDDQLCHTHLIEKLLIPLINKTSCFIPNGGIWLNAQRPEWNDANNALVGYGVSMVTLYYMQRYCRFMIELLDQMTENEITLYSAVQEWLSDCKNVLNNHTPLLQQKLFPAGPRKAFVDGMGKSFEKYRKSVYAQNLGERIPVTRLELLDFLKLLSTYLEHTVASSQRDDGLFQAYNLYRVEKGEMEIEHLYPMLEGQVAALSSPGLSPESAIDVLDKLRLSSLYREDQNSYILYPNRNLPRFLEKNIISAEAASKLRNLPQFLDLGIIQQSNNGTYRFRPELYNAEQLKIFAENISKDDLEPLLELYEDIFNHHAFTGRSGTMFGYEGLGSIYWHMVSKLLLAVQEKFFLMPPSSPLKARLAEKYFEVQNGLSYNKSPQEYGAFPTDPYSHTPGHTGARQPGMTGQVKEEIITRLGELGLRVNQGQLWFDNSLLREQEFLTSPAYFNPIDLDGNRMELQLEEGSLGYTYCQVPVILRKSERECIIVHFSSGEERTVDGHTLSSEESGEIFNRTGKIARLEVEINPGL